MLIQYQQREIVDFRTIEKGMLSGMAKLEEILQEKA